MSKPYATLRLSEVEFRTINGTCSRYRDEVFRKSLTTTGEEQKFYIERMAVYDALLARFDAILVADTSQDAEEEEDDEEEES